MVVEKVKPAYIQTEVGIIPEDWEVDEIQNHSQIITGAKNTQDRIEDGQFPFFVRSQKVERINTYSYDGEAVLTAGDGVGTGKVFHYINGKFDFHQRVYMISNFDKKLDGYFFYLYFSNYFLARIMGMTAKSSVDSVRRDMIAKMPIILPEKKEQIAISASIRCVIELIETLDTLIEKKKSVKLGIIQKLLTKGIGHTKFKKVTFLYGTDEEIPEDWNVTTISDFTLSHKQGFYTNQPYSNTGVRLIRISDMHNPKISYETMPFVELDDRTLDQFSVSKGDVLFARSGAAIGTFGIVNDDIRAVFASYLIRFTFDSKIINNNYFGFAYSSFYVLKQQNMIRQGSSNININAENIKSIKLILPPLPEQEKISIVISNMVDEIEELEKKKDKYLKIKNGMMQQLITGKIRLR